MGDFEAIGSAAERLDEAGEAAFIASLEAPSLWGIALWGRQPEAQMPFVSSGFGDGRYPIYELVSSRGRVGIEVVFIDLSEAEVHIGHPKTEFLHIRVTGRSHPASVDYWDGNWFNTEVTILAGGFRGRVEGYLRAEELATFNDELTALYNSLSGTVSFETIEQWLSIKMSTDGRGHIAAECVVRDKPGMGNTLTFSLDLDQSFLPALLQQLEEITTLFPVLGSPPTPDP